MKSALSSLVLVFASPLVGACSGESDGTAASASEGSSGGSTDASTSAASTGTGTTSTTTGSGGDAASDAGSATETSGASAGTTTGGSTTTTGDPTTTSGDPTTTGDPTTGGVEVPPPDQAGPCEYAEIKASFKSPKTGNNVPVRALYPTSGPYAAPYPVVTVAHGFQLAASQYDNYVERLASFCFVAINVDFPAGFVANHVANSQDIAGALDWAASEPKLKDIADVDNAGATGHSLGGKASILAASADPRYKASITLDPVDTAAFCNPDLCPDASDMLPLDMPLGFLGETLDGTGGLMSCAPLADNYQTFYAEAAAPALEVTVLGANHMSFIDDVASCGLACGACKMATADNATVNALSQAFVAAFYQRHLRGELAYESWLTGADAQAAYVDTEQVTIKSK